MKMPASRVVVLIVMMACGFAGWGWWHLGRTEEKLQHLRLELLDLNREMEARIHTLRSEHVAEQPSGRPEQPAALEESRHRRVAEVVAQLKRERVPRTTPRVPPHPGGVYEVLMENPEYAQLNVAIRRHGWLARNHRLLRLAGIPAELHEEMCELVMERDFSGSDARWAAKKLGQDEREAWETARKVAAKIEDELKKLVGEAAYERFSLAQRSYAANELIQSFETRLSYSGPALTDEQAQRVFAVAAGIGLDYMLEAEQVAPLIEGVRPVLTDEQLAPFRQVVEEFNYGKSRSVKSVSSRSSSAR